MDGNLEVSVRITPRTYKKYNKEREQAVRQRDSSIGMLPARECCSKLSAGQEPLVLDQSAICKRSQMAAVDR